MSWQEILKTRILSLQKKFQKSNRIKGCSTCGKIEWLNTKTINYSGARINSPLQYCWLDLCKECRGAKFAGTYYPVSFHTSQYAYLNDDGSNSFDDAVRLLEGG